jgi:hypothetical protein
MRRTKVLHCELQQHLPSELDKLSDMSTGEQHIIHIKDEEDWTPVGCVLDVVAIYRTYGSKGGGTTGVLDQGIRRVGDRPTACCREVQLANVAARAFDVHTEVHRPHGSTFPVWNDRRTRPADRTIARLPVWHDRSTRPTDRTIARPPVWHDRRKRPTDRTIARISV